MLSRIARFELSYQLRSPLFFVAFALFFLSLAHVGHCAGCLGAASTEAVVGLGAFLVDVAHAHALEEANLLVLGRF